MNDPKTVLIAEDEIDLREALATALTQVNITVLEAADGQTAIEMARNTPPDLVILDIKMPTMSGLEALRLLRAEKWGEKIPVIMLTAQADVENLSEAVTTGGTNMEYLTKTDWRLSDVVNKVQDKLAQVEAKEKAEAATKATEEPGS